MSVSHALDSGAVPRAPARPPLDALALGMALLAIICLQQTETGSALVSGRLYWEDWSDQSKYLASARAFAETDLTPARHWYPLLYPLALAPFVKLSPFVAASLVDALCYALAFVGFASVAARFGVSRLHAILLFLATTLVGEKPMTAWIVPWTTTLSAALIWLALARVARVIDPSEAPPERRALAETGLLLALIPLCRPADAAISAILGLFVLARLWRSPGLVAVAAGAGAAVVAGYGALHLAIYGAAQSDYMKLSAAFGLETCRLGWKAMTLLVYPGPFFPTGAGLVERYPWLLLGAAGLIVAAIRPERRRLSLLVGLPLLAYAALMLSYVDLTASNFWTFRLLHYFKWTLPAQALFAYGFVREFRRRMALSLGALAAVAATGCLQYEAVAVGPDEPAEALLFVAPPQDVATIANGRSILADRAGIQRNLLDFHQFPDGKGFVLAVASRRDFAGGEVWRDSPAGLNWPVLQPPPDLTPPLLGATEPKPLARYRAISAFGPPCWLAPRACRRALPPDKR